MQVVDEIQVSARTTNSRCIPYQYIGMDYPMLPGSRLNSTPVLFSVINHFASAGEAVMLHV
jgi:hypothetical protein